MFVVEHELDVIREADWIVDVGPGAGERGGEVLYSGPLPGLERADGFSTGGFDDGSDVGIEGRTPNGSEAVGDFAEGHARPQRSLGLVVGRSQSAIGDEDEQIAPDFSKDALELDAFTVCGLLAQESLSFLTNFLL